jgi:hypothetical protein
MFQWRRAYCYTAMSYSLGLANIFRPYKAILTYVLCRYVVTLYRPRIERRAN